MSNNYVLEVKPGHMVDYVMIAFDGTRVQHRMSFFNAPRFLQGDVRATEDVPGFPLTADGRFFFRGWIEEPHEKGVF